MEHYPQILKIIVYSLMYQEHVNQYSGLQKGFKSQEGVHRTSLDPYSKARNTSYPHINISVYCLQVYLI